jgi:hypothetical protein
MTECRVRHEKDCAGVRKAQRNLETRLRRLSLSFAPSAAPFILRSLILICKGRSYYTIRRPTCAHSMSPKNEIFYVKAYDMFNAPIIEYLLIFLRSGNLCKTRLDLKRLISLRVRLQAIFPLQDNSCHLKYEPCSRARRELRAASLSHPERDWQSLTVLRRVLLSLLSSLP